MLQRLYALWREEDGQDLVEYSLLITFVALVCMGIFGSGRDPVAGLWGQVQDKLDLAVSLVN